MTAVTHKVVTPTALAGKAIAFNDLTKQADLQVEPSKGLVVNQQNQLSIDYTSLVANIPADSLFSEDRVSELAEAAIQKGLAAEGAIKVAVDAAIQAADIEGKIAQATADKASQTDLQEYQRLDGMSAYLTTEAAAETYSAKTELANYVRADELAGKVEELVTSKLTVTITDASGKPLALAFAPQG